MTTLAEFFEREAGASLQRLRALAGSSAPDRPAVHRAARTLRGSAQMAREERVYRAALALETALKPAAAGNAAGNGAWSEPLLGCVRAAIEDLAVLVEGSDPSPELDGRLRASLERWQAAGVELPAPAVGRRSTAETADGMREFRAYAAREVDGIAEALDQGMRALRVNPMDRDALKAILRRQRALRGAARLEEIPVVAEILRAVEDLSRVVAKLDVGVKQEWFDVYRAAREGLAAAIPALGDDRDPQPSSGLARLRHLRTELLGRYGTADGPGPGAPAAAASPVVGVSRGAMAPPAAMAPRAAPAAPAGAASPVVGVSPAAMAPFAGAASPVVAASPARPATSEPAPVPIAELEYHGQEALRRALTLRQGLEDALGDDPAARELLEELFDLIRLGLG